MSDRLTTTLGLGLIGIGREWGIAPANVPSEDDAVDFLQYAYSLGIQFFDTAPSYGYSEKRVGAFLSTLSSRDRSRITVATKAGEYWSEVENCLLVDHTYDALCRSLDRSIEILGTIDLLQIHKTSVPILESADFVRFVEYARAAGVRFFGASVADRETALIACRHSSIAAVQFPYNAANRMFEDVIDYATDRSLMVIVNRPLNMGKMVEDLPMVKRMPVVMEAFAFILERNFRGVILTGTKSKEHLLQNIEAFKTAIAKRAGLGA